VIPAGLWSFIVPFQLIPQLRKYAPFLHRISGYIMFSTVPFIVTGVGLIFIKKLDFEYDFQSNINEPLSEFGFAPIKDSFVVIRIFVGVIAVYFAATSLLALQYARAKKFILHRKWIIRHIAAGVWVALQRWYLVFRNPTTLGTSRAAFYDGVFIAVFITVCTAELYLWLEDFHNNFDVHDDVVKHKVH
jgi:succinate dehydrogenase/fumarate reductase cytochrome b subunit